ncbi:LIC_12616 family protein [uncultured Deefgea sp.]|uniref:phage neck terminator protein n=1 Tax=uncultured Deefgea sp. TaxID=1304914 RepID=UPI002637E8BB|nr:hypothetical protein [uncultured Deefgea sp.]
MITTVADFNLADFRKLISETLGLPIALVVPENEAHSVANTAFITVGVAFSENLSYGSQSWDPVTEIIRYNTDWLLTIDVNAYGKNSESLLRKLCACLNQVSATKLALRKLKLGFVSHSTIRDLSAMALPTWEERAQVSFQISYSHIIQTEQRRIDIVRLAIHDEFERVDILL